MPIVNQIVKKVYNVSYKLENIQIHKEQGIHI